jgi:hypothetical protein
VTHDSTITSDVSILCSAGNCQLVSYETSCCLLMICRCRGVGGAKHG